MLSSLKKIGNYFYDIEDKKIFFFLQKIAFIFSLLNISKNKRINNFLSRLFYQGINNNKYILSDTENIWPYWAYLYFNNLKKQFYPSQFLLNNIYEKNWTLIGFPFENNKLVVDSHGLIMPTELGWSLDIWYSDQEKIYSPAKLTDVKQKIVNNFPIVETIYQVADTIISTTIFLKTNFKKNTDNFDNVFMGKIRVTNTNDSNKSNGSIYLAIRPYNSEGITEISQITYLSQNAFIVDNKLALVLLEKPDNIICSNYKEGDVAKNAHLFQMILKSNCTNKLCSALAEYKLELSQNTAQEIYFQVLPPKEIKINQKNNNANKDLKLTDYIKKLKALNFEQEFINLNKEWLAIKEGLLQITIPDKKLQNIFEKISLHLHTFIKKNEVIAGGLIYNNFWLRDMIFLLRALNRIGSSLYSEEIILAIINHKNLPNINDELDSLGQLLYIIYDTYQYSNDITFLEKTFYFVSQIITKINHHTYHHSFDDKYNGLLDKSFSMDYLNEKDFFLWDNLWLIKGLFSAHKIAETMQHQSKANHYYEMHQKYLSNLNKKILEICQKENTEPLIPITPTRFNESKLIYSLSALYPLNIYGENDEFIINTINKLTSNFTENDLIYNSAFKGFSIYENILLANVNLIKANYSKAYHILNWLKDVTSETGSIPEIINPINKKGIFGDGDYVAGESEFVVLIRNLLIKENEDSLEFLPYLPAEWLAIDSQENLIEIKNVPTKFGKISFSINKYSSKIDMTFNANFLNLPKEIIIFLPLVIKSVCYQNIKRPIYNSYFRIPIDITEFSIII